MKIKTFSELKWRSTSLKMDPQVFKWAPSIEIWLKMVSVNVVAKCVFGKKIHMGSSKLSCNMFHHQFQSCVLNPPDFLVDKKKKKVKRWFTVPLKAKDVLMSVLMLWWWYDDPVGKGRRKKDKPPSENQSLMLMGKGRSSFNYYLSFYCIRGAGRRMGRGMFHRNAKWEIWRDPIAV